MNRRGTSITELLTVITILVVIGVVIYSFANKTVDENINCSECITKKLENREAIINNQVKED